MFESRNRPFAPALAAALAVIALAGCHASSEGPESPPPPTEVATAYFNSTTGFFPYPIDLYFSPSAAAPLPDGTLNIPTLPYRGAAMQAGMNSQDGWSTIAPLNAFFSKALKTDTISASTIKIIKFWADPTTPGGPVNPADPTKQVFLPAGATSPVAGVLTYGVDFTADLLPAIDSNGKVLRITLLKPLAFSTGPAVNDSGANLNKILKVGYQVVLTNGLQSDEGVAVTPDTEYASYAAAPADCSTFTGTPNLLCKLVKAQLGIAQATGTPAANVVLTWSFTTQSVDDVLDVVAKITQPQQTLVVPSGSKSPRGKADIYVGSTKLPYYLQPATSTSDKVILSTFWKAAGPPNPAFGLDAASRNLTLFNPVPAPVTTVTVPLIVSIPNFTTSACKARPANGWPVAIVLHGITRQRSDAMAMADSFADRCIIVAAIDQPLHGVTDPANPLYCTPAKPQCIGAQERTFDVDLVNNTSGAAFPDGKTDASGTHSINVASPATSRDNLRQAEADLIQLTKSIPGLAIAPGTPVPAGPVGVDSTRLHFVGQSLGAIVGGAHIHFVNDLRSATLESPGGMLSKILFESPSFKPRTVAGLNAAGIVPDSYAYYLFQTDFQTVIDSGDPINHIKDAQAMHPLHLMEVKDDQVVQNASTDLLIKAGGLRKLKTIGPNAVGPGTGGYVFFTQGTHGNMFDPTGNQAVLVEMQTQTVLFADTVNSPGGPFVVLTNPTVLDLN